MLTPSPSRTEAAIWRLLGLPGKGGVVAALAVSPDFARDHTVCLGSSLAIHLSRDGGRTWKTAEGAYLTTPVTSVAFSPDFAHDHTIFATALGQGLWRSSDGGKTWDFLMETTANAVTVSPGFARAPVLLLATDFGIFRSENGGQNWQEANRGLADRAAQVVALSPAFPTDGIAFAIAADLLHRSDDGGRTWHVPEGEGLAGHVPVVIALSPDFTQDRTLFAGTEDAGLFRSADGGRTWQAVGPENLTGVNSLNVSSAEDLVLVAGTAEGSIWRSANGGDTWQEVVTGLSSVLALAGSGEVLFAGTYGEGVFRSPDGGFSWATANDGFAARGFVSLAVSSNVLADGTLFMAGPEEGIYRSRDGGNTWESVGLAEAGINWLTVSPAFSRDRSLLAAGRGGLFRSRDGGDSWESLAIAGPVQRVAFSPAVASGVQLLAASGPNLFHSTDGGDTWDALRVPWAGDEVAAIAFSPNYARDGTLLAVTGVTSGDTGYDVAAVWRSFDGGRSWQRVVRQNVAARWLTLALPPDYDATAGPHRAYIGWGNQVLRPILTGPKHWTAGMLGPANLTVLSLALSPTFSRDRTIYAATNQGIYRSTNEGLTWQPWSEGLGNVPTVVVAACTDERGAANQRVYTLALGGAVWCWEG
ncbi:MAG: hypothetical protein IT330_18780 [Anaerolineae bacterium]|nr:hypothetical protein [Anaerolineae bacterium]